MEAVVVHRVRFLDYFCPKQGEDFKPSAAPIYPNMGKVPPRDKKSLSVCTTLVVLEEWLTLKQSVPNKISQ